MAALSILNNAFRNLKDIYQNHAGAIAKQTGQNRLWILLDCLYARLRHGCDIEQYTLGKFYLLRNFERKQSLTIHRKNKLVNALNPAQDAKMLGDKVLFNKHFKQFIQRKWLYSCESSWQDFEAFVTDYPTPVLLKPIDAMQGKGIEKRVISSHDELARLYEETKDKKILIEQFIEQHPQMVFGNKSVNTLRMMTMVDRQGKGHVLKAILRAGVGDSVVDNYCSGGVIYDVDLDTGIVSSPGRKEHDTDNTIIIHPQTDIIMLGYRLPNWDQVMATARAAAEHFPQCRMIGFDIAITPTGAELIEGNESPHIGLYEYLGKRGYYQKILNLL